MSRLRRVSALCAALFALGACSGQPRAPATPAPLSAMDAGRLAQCQVLARRAHLRTPYLTQSAVFLLAAQTLRDHGVLAPHNVRGTWQVHRVRQSDIQAAADELKVCFPPA